MIIRQGESRRVPFTLYQDGIQLTPDTLVNLEVYVGKVLCKTFSKGEVTFDKDNGEWGFRLTQTETMQLPSRKYGVDVRVKYLDTPDSDVIGVYIGDIEIVATPSREVL